MRWTALLFAAALAGCGQDPEPKPAGDADAGEAWTEEPRDDDYIDPTEDPDPAAFDAAGVAAVVEDALAEARGVSAAPIVEAHAESLTWMDADCPQWAVEEDTPYWFDSCTSSSGAAFEGYGYVLEYDELPDGDILWDGLALYSISSIVGPEGQTLVSGGGAGLLAGVQSDGALIYYTYMEEGFSYDGPSAEDTWLASGTSPELVSYGIHYDETGGKALLLSGRVEVPSGPVQAVVFDDLLLGNAAIGSGCPIEPSGALSVLGEDGWYDLVFDGPGFEEFGGEAAASCDGCGVAWHKGVALGEACVDFSVMTRWSVHPWE